MVDANGGISGLVIGQRWSDPTVGQVLRIVVIDPDLESVEAEDYSGAITLDSIRHFRATHICLLAS